MVGNKRAIEQEDRDKVVQSGASHYCYALAYLCMAHRIYTNRDGIE